MAALDSADLFALEFTDTFIDLNGLTATARTRVASMMRVLQDDLTDAIARADLEGIASESVRRRRLEQLIRDVRKTIERRFTMAAKRLDVDERRIAAFAHDESIRIINQVFTVNIATPTLTRPELKALIRRDVVLGEPAADWWSGQAEGTRRKFAREMRLGVLQGETNQQMIQRVRGRATGRTISIQGANGKFTRVREFRGGLMQATTRQADALVRTSVQSVSNNALLNTYQDNKDVLKGYRALTTLDDRTSHICMARTGGAWSIETGEALPESSVNEDFPGSPPWHFRAILAGTMVITNGGECAVEEMHPGDLVLTHKGRLRPVSSVMSKPECGLQYGLHFDSGRVLWVTAEHPLLSSSGRWVRADSLKAGDELFKYAEEGEQFGVVVSLESIAEEHPPGFEESFGPDRVVLDPVLAAMSFAVDLQDELAGKRKVENVSPNRHLELERCVGKIQSIEHQALRPCGVVSEKVGALDHVSSLGLGVAHGVVARHPVGVCAVDSASLFGEPVGPVVGTGDAGRVFAVEAGGLPLASDFDSVFLDEEIEPGFAQAETSLDGSDGLTIMKMADLDDFLHFGFVHARIVRVETKHIKCRVYNLSVTEDETYIADGVVTHNCRSILSPITKSWDELIAEAGGKDEKLLNTVPNSTRSSMTGSIKTASVHTFDDWLRIRGDTFARDKLGPGIFDLWKGGNITLSQLIDQAGKTRSLAQLRAL